MVICIQKELPVRKDIRLSGYDYTAAGYYFVTICVKDGHMMLGKIVGNGLARSVYIELSDYGIIANREMQKLSSHYSDVMVDQYVIMPNHIHAIVIIRGGITERASPFPTLGNIIGGYKSGVSRLCGFSFWQPRFHDHIIRDEAEYRRIWQYIDENPARWAEDDYFV